MSRASNLAKAIGADGTLNVSDVAGLAAVASSGSASDLSTGTLPIARIADGAVTYAKLSSDVQGDMNQFKNRIINGAMMIDQRNAGASGTNNSTYTVDRWAYYGNQTSKGTWGQNLNSVTPPAGFKNYLGFQSSSAYSPSSGDEFEFYQKIEGYNFADMGFGAVGASTITFSFWVRSSLTGTFGGSLRNAAATRSYAFTYTINSANTWEYKTVTVAGDTSGTWATDNSTGLTIHFSLGVGSTYSGASGSWASANYVGATGQVNVISTNAATFYITGVQLEKGSTATSFDFRSYGTELALCQRYLYSANNVVSGSNYQPLASGVVVSATSNGAVFQFPQVMRATPSVTSSGALRLTDMVNWSVAISSLDAAYIGASSGLLLCNTVSNVITSSGAAGKGLYLGADGATVRILFSAEL